jgi:hypothetical protein
VHVDLGGVVEDHPAGDASGEIEDVAEPLADASGGLSAEDPGGPHVGVRESDGGVPAPGDHTADPEFGLPEVHPTLARNPAELQVTLGVAPLPLPSHPLPAALHVALDTHGREGQQGECVEALLWKVGPGDGLLGMLDGRSGARRGEPVMRELGAVILNTVKWRYKGPIVAVTTAV